MTRQRFRVLPSTYEQSAQDQQQRDWSKLLLVLTFVLPGFILFLLFVLMPIAQSAVFSAFRWDGFGPLTEYVGIGNYQRMFDHKAFQDALSHSFIIMVLSITIQLPLALALALMVGRGQLSGKKVIRTILFVPYVFSEVITALIFRYVMNPTDGMLNVVLGSIIPGYENIGWLANREIVIYSVFIVITWKYFGFHMILYMAGLQGVPRDLEDAARVDGANEWQVLRGITLPLMGPTIRMTIFLSVLGSFQQFETVWVMTEGGPVGGSELITTYLFKFGIQRFNLGYGSAVAVILFCITLFFSVGYQRVIMRQDYAVDRI